MQLPSLESRGNTVVRYYIKYPKNEGKGTASVNLVQQSPHTAENLF